MNFNNTRKKSNKIRQIDISGSGSLCTNGTNSRYSLQQRLIRRKNVQGFLLMFFRFATSQCNKLFFKHINHLGKFSFFFLVNNYFIFQFIRNDKLQTLRHEDLHTSNKYSVKVYNYQIS
jgi:hypothetical protein